MIDNTVKFNAGALRDAVRYVLGMSDHNLIVFAMRLRGARLTDIGLAFKKFGTADGEAKALASKLADRDAARRFAADIMRRFAPWGDILRDAIPHRQHWANEISSGNGPFDPVDAPEAHRRMLKQRVALGLQFGSVAKILGVKRNHVFTYISRGYLDCVQYLRVRRITRESVERLLSWRDGVRYTAEGVSVERGAYASRGEVCATLGRAESAVNKLANDGRLVRVYNHPTKGGQCCGYTLASVSAVMCELAEGVYFTAHGKVYATERISQQEARKLIGRRNMFLAGLANAGIIERVFLDPKLMRAYGYTRASVVAYLQANPHKATARAAVAIENFMIAALPPVPRPRHETDGQSLRARDLAPAETEPAAWIPKPKRIRPSIVFRIIDITPETEVSMETPQPAKRTAEKLDVAKAFTIHEGGIIRAICVSEEDRDEIRNALNFWRKYKDRESEIESSVAFFRDIKARLGIPENAPCAGEAVVPGPTFSNSTVCEDNNQPER